MKVLHVIDSLGLGGGAEHALAQQLPGLRDAGIDGEVAVLTHRGFGLEETVTELGFPIHVLAGPSLLRRVRSLRRLVEKTKPDLVHATLWDSCLTSRIALLGKRTPLINSIVNLTYDPVRREFEGRTRWRDEIIRLIDAITIRRVDRIHVLTEAVANDTVRALRVKRSKITVIPRGREVLSLETVAATRSRVRNDMGLSDEVPVVITVGRQDLQKDQATLVRAFANVRALHRDAQLWLVGRPGSQTSEIQEVIEGFGSESGLTVFGHRNDAFDLLCAADVFVFPSVYEGLGSAVVEAMSVGLPVLASDSPVLTEVVGESALRFPSRCENALSKQLTKLLSSSGQRARVASQARARCEAAYTLTSVVDSLAQLYKQCRQYANA